MPVDDMSFAIDEGRILLGPDGRDLISRALGTSYQASWDVSVRVRACVRARSRTFFTTINTPAPRKRPVVMVVVFTSSLLRAADVSRRCCAPRLGSVCPQNHVLRLQLVLSLGCKRWPQLSRSVGIRSSKSMASLCLSLCVTYVLC